MTSKTSTQIATENARLSTAQLATLTGLCTIQRKALSEDSYGGQTQVWSNLATNVKCASNFNYHGRYDGEESLNTTENITQETSYFFHLPPSQDVTNADRIVYLGVTFEVTYVRPPITVEALRELDVVVVR